MASWGSVGAAASNSSSTLANALAALQNGISSGMGAGQEASAGAGQGVGQGMGSAGEGYGYGSNPVGTVKTGEGQGSSNPKPVSAPTSISPVVNPSPTPAPAPVHVQNTDVSGYSGATLAAANNNVAHGYDANYAGTSFQAAQKQDAAAASKAAADKAAAAQAAAAPKPAPTIAIPDPTGDATYQQQHSSFLKALADFKSGQQLAGAQYKGQYNQGLAKLGWNGQNWDGANTNASYGNAINNNQEDYAARGAYNSGLFGKSVDSINHDFNDQKTNLDTANKDYGATQGQALQNYQSTSDQADKSALLDAIGRIAQKYNVDPGQVIAGKTNTVPVTQ